MSFITPFFLFASGLALLPVLFHFVRKMQAKKMPFSSLLFLQATPLEQVRRRRLRDLLLLALRMAMLLLLAVAFARPFIPQEHLPFVTERRDQSIVILIDLSYSMQVQDLFEQAREALMDQIATTTGRDEVALIGFDVTARQLTPLSSNTELHRAVAARLMPGNGATDIYTALRLAVDALQDARHEARKIVLVSDFQTNGFPGSMENYTLGGDIRFEPVKITREDITNSYVEAFELTTRRAAGNVAVRYDARVRSEEHTTSQAKAARLVVEEHTEERMLPALTSSPVTFRQMVSRTGLFQGFLSLEADDLAVDNRYFFTYRIDDIPSILVVDGGADRRDAFFLRNAFALGEGALFSFATGSRLDREAFRGHDIVFVTNSNALPPVQLRALQIFAEEGGSVIMSPGEETSSSNLRQLGLGTTEGMVTSRLLQGSDAIIAQIDEHHPIFNLFASSGRSAILRPVFRRYLQVTPDSGTTVLGHYDTGDPFLLEKRAEQGRILLYTSSFSTRWTDLPLHEFYVPLLYQMARYARRNSDAEHQFVVGEAISLTGAVGDIWDVRTHSGKVLKVPVDSTGRGFFRETSSPGHYTAALGRTLLPFSVNVDPRESVLETRDEQEAYVDIVGEAENVGTPAREATLVEEEKEQKLWRVVIIVLLLLFVAESLLAHKRQMT